MVFLQLQEAPDSIYPMEGLIRTINWQNPPKTLCLLLYGSPYKRERNVIQVEETSLGSGLWLRVRRHKYFDHKRFQRRFRPFFASSDRVKSFFQLFTPRLKFINIIFTCLAMIYPFPSWDQFSRIFKNKYDTFWWFGKLFFPCLNYRNRPNQVNSQSELVI